MSVHGDGIVIGAPSGWVKRWSHLLPRDATVLDVACGSGRHIHYLADRGMTVTGVDRDARALAPISDFCETIVADLENGPWPLPGRHFDAVLVTNYLWRALFPDLRSAVKPGGWMIYETFNTDQAAIGRPTRAEFLLRPGELLEALSGWTVVAYEHGFLREPDRHAQRIVARKPLLEGTPVNVPARWALE